MSISQNERICYEAGWAILKYAEFAQLYLQQGCTRVTLVPATGANFVDFVDQNDRVGRLRALEALQTKK